MLGDVDQHPASVHWTPQARPRPPACGLPTALESFVKVLGSCARVRAPGAEPLGCEVRPCLFNNLPR